MIDYVMEQMIMNINTGKYSVIKSHHDFLNSSLLSATYMHQWIVSALAQIMACHLFGTKPLSDSVLNYYQMDPWEQILVKFWSKYKTFHYKKCI